MTGSRSSTPTSTARGSVPVRIDAERPTFGARSLTRRIPAPSSSPPLLPLGTAHKGVEKPRLWLGVAIPGDTVGNFGSALELLGQRATYLYYDSSHYWYDTTASVTRTRGGHGRPAAGGTRTGLGRDHPEASGHRREADRGVHRRAHRPGDQRRRPRQRGRPTGRDSPQVRARQIRPQLRRDGLCPTNTHDGRQRSTDPGQQ